MFNPYCFKGFLTRVFGCKLLAPMNAAVGVALLNVPQRRCPETQPGFLVTSDRKVYILTVLHETENN